MHRNISSYGEHSNFHIQIYIYTFVMTEFSLDPPPTLYTPEYVLTPLFALPRGIKSPPQFCDFFFGRGPYFSYFTEHLLLEIEEARR